MNCTDDLTKGLRPRRAVRSAMANDIAMYGIVQKEGLGFDKAVEKAKERMSRYNVSVSSCRLFFLGGGSSKACG